MSRRFSHVCKAAGLFLAPITALLLLATWETRAGQGSDLGGPLPGLSELQLRAFQRGKEEFEQIETIETGLGPVFNARSCNECHAHPVSGGSAPELEVAREIRIGRRVNGVFDPLENLGGSDLQRRSLKELDSSFTVLGEVVPPEATFVSRRITQPLFGIGLMEAIPEREILRRADPKDHDRDGISGRPNYVLNPETQQVELGRFGWKAHISTLRVFSGDAYLTEMGITTPLFPHEKLPQGQPIPPGEDRHPEDELGPEATGEAIGNFFNFMRFLAPAPRREITPEVRRGGVLFRQIGCSDCHTPAMTTGNHPVPALRRQRVHLFSDLLLHNMGARLADGIEMGVAKGNEWRTAPLWGLSRRKFFLHDGRALTIRDAILAHGGEARRARGNFEQPAPGKRDALLAFLNSL